MDHAWIQENLLALNDDLLPPKSRSVIEAHLQDCLECRTEWNRWRQTSAAFIQPLQLEASEIFVQNVMRKVRAYGQREERMAWPLFARWAFPALALSMTVFAFVLAYALPPARFPTDALLIENQGSNFSVEWLAASPDEDQILDSVAVRP